MYPEKPLKKNYRLRLPLVQKMNPSIWHHIEGRDIYVPPPLKLPKRGGVVQDDIHPYRSQMSGMYIIGVIHVLPMPVRVWLFPNIAEFILRVSSVHVRSQIGP